MDPVPLSPPQRYSGTVREQNEQMAASYKFGVFDIKKEYNNKRNFSMSVSAKRRTGKSVLVKDLCHQIKGWYKKVYVFSLTAQYQPGLFDFIEEQNIYNGLNEEKLLEIWKSQALIIERIRKVSPNIEAEKMPMIMVILDDIIGDERFKNSAVMKNILVAGRHINIAVCIITQSFVAIPKLLRRNMDIAIAFYLDDELDRENFAKSYLSTKSRKLGMMVFENITKDPYNAIIVMNSITSPNIEESVRTYKAELKVPKFEMGSRPSLKAMKNQIFIERNIPSSGAQWEDFLPEFENPVNADERPVFI